MKTLKSALFALCIGALTSTAAAQGELTASPLYQGPYLAPMASFILTKDKDFGTGLGGTLAAGYRKGWWAIEASGLYADFKGSNGGDSTSAQGGTINGLIFPLKALPNLYGVLGFGGLEIKSHPVVNRSYSLTTSEAGAGYIFPLSYGRYEFGIRADARYRYGHREERVQPDRDLAIPKDYQDILFNVGLQLPLGLKPVPPPPPVVEVAVVPTAAICADGLDNDGDGKIDFPADPGCKSAEGSDETDPPQCSDGLDNDGDGLIDFPNDKGCTAADDDNEVDPPPPCMPPESGERISLKGCGTGDIIVLRGVNFEFDKTRLTANARTILDGVADELRTYPGIKVELSGHTDAKGTDDYNQALSNRRATAVLKYLLGKGIAADRMTSIGYGESKPVADNETDAGRELNRRVELKVTDAVSGVAAAAASPVAAESPAAATEPTIEPAAAEPATTAPAAKSAEPVAAPASTTGEPATDEGTPDEMEDLITK